MSSNNIHTPRTTCGRHQLPKVGRSVLVLANSIYNTKHTHTVFGWHCGWCSLGTMRITDSIILGWPKSPSMFVDTYLAFVGLTFRGQCKSKSSRDEWLNMYRDHVSQLGLAMYVGCTPLITVEIMNIRSSRLIMS